MEGRRPSASVDGNLPLQNKSIALVFEKPSLRTRVAFEAGVTQLGGHASYLSANDIDMGGRESVPDVARNLSRWVQAISARVFRHGTIEELARYASIPVINALSDQEHPCQALADMLTLLEHYGRLRGLRLAYIGDGNNVCNSLMLLGATLGVSIAVGCPPDYRPDPDFVARAQRLADESDATITISADPVEAVAGADAVYTDVWTSMGQEHEVRAAPAGLPALPGERGADGAGARRHAVYALPAGPSRRGGRRRGDRRPQLGGVRPGRESPARAEGADPDAAGDLRTKNRRTKN